MCNFVKKGTRSLSKIQHLILYQIKNPSTQTNTSHIHGRPYRKKCRFFARDCTDVHLGWNMSRTQASWLLFTLNSHPPLLTSVILILHVYPALISRRKCKRVLQNADCRSAGKLKILPQEVSISFLREETREICVQKKTESYKKILVTAEFISRTAHFNDR